LDAFEEVEECHMPAREWYRHKARACAAAAENMVEPAERAVMLEIAQAYMKLADHIVARHHHGTAHRSVGDRPMRADT
jgi:hypothetical protein